jgi:hypothetical protein
MLQLILTEKILTVREESEDNMYIKLPNNIIVLLVTSFFEDLFEINFVVLSCCQPINSQVTCEK